MENSSLVYRDDQSSRQLTKADAAGNTSMFVRQYNFAVDMNTAKLATIVASALEAFGLDAIALVIADEVQFWTRDEVEAFGTGMHEWNDEA